FHLLLYNIEEPVILGTSGALDNARHLLEGETFVVINGKIITGINLMEALETHRRENALATLVLRPNPKLERFSCVETRDGLITGFGGMPAPTASDNAPDNEAAPLMFTGIQILEPRIFDYIPRGVFSHSTTNVYPQAIKAGERVVAHVAEGKWYELSTIPRYLEISLALLADEGKETDIGERCRISDEADVRETLLWNDVTIERGAKVRRAILGDGVRIPSGEVIEDAAVVRAALVRDKEPPPKALRGEVRGENFVVSLRQ
ncbi:MAG: NDP-sugar synthase, partial [Acidobacteria bacterium]|nr:NDP-sugar synthase [Acidobacteriota bacterium]